MYLQGRGVTQDYKAAIKWFELAAEKGEADAQVNLGMMYLQGLGVTQDYKAAFNWYMLAAGQGNAIAQYNLGLMYVTGKGVNKDFHRAYMWWHFAALQGHENAAGNRSKVEYEMTPTQIEKAQKLARECIAKNYKDC
jgi:TPR repeat protein